MSDSTTSQDFSSSPLSSKSKEWNDLHAKVNELRQLLDDGLRDTSRIMEQWERRLQEEKDAYSDAIESCRRRNAQREARYKEDVQSMEKWCEEKYKHQLSEKESQIENLKSDIRRLETRKQELSSRLDEYKGLITKIEALADITKERFNHETHDPKTIIQAIGEQFDAYEQSRNDLLAELGKRPTELQVRDLESHVERLEKEKEDLQHSQKALSELQKNYEAVVTSEENLKEENERLQFERNTFRDKNILLNAQLGNLRKEMEKLRNIYQNADDRAARIRNIEIPLIRFDSRPEDISEISELDWLRKISDGCESYGLKFPERILYSFHTSLKTAEWSPITVLAGVSGTGKSELPRLYSHFGGINFLSLPVQPNWDSQEAMLGYFNTIDNVFDAQPVLRLLAQSQLPWGEETQGLRDYMTMVLMDEMNLAHVELYFAEFLSKLELRRGCADEAEPELSVKLGANMVPYPLRMGRNVLWAGTMNQDETTKSLSDKVLDRSVVINFPRPSRLFDRSGYAALPESRALLPRATWKNWQDSAYEMSDKVLATYRKRVEQINDHLGKVGRAIGHRVWQSIQNYMMNYPTVIKNGKEGIPHKALDEAFEDQLVQKIMPKLRGIETTGAADKECLIPIRNVLADFKNGSLLDDFDLARKSGYGQFMWNSALYLTEKN